MPRKSIPGQPLRSPRTVVRSGARKSVPAAPRDPLGVYPATRPELVPIALAALILAFLALMIAASRGIMLLYGDAVAHLGIARRILDAHYPGLAQLGGVWLPLPHLLIVPFAQNLQWWQNGTAGAWPSLASYVVGVVGCYVLARKLVPSTWAFVATAFFALNPNLLYLSTTAMNEPLFLALLLWSVVVAWEAMDALAGRRRSVASARLILSGVLTLAMVLTRYDGWVEGALLWVLLALAWGRADADTRRATRTAFVTMTLLSIAGPIFWFWYNAHYMGDWLDFMRGPYSAAAIEKKTTPPGSLPRRGMYNPGWALLYFTRAAQVDTVAYELGFGVLIAAIAGSALMWKNRLARMVVLLLWLPLPFYVYSVCWGHVPIFVPQLYPGSFYNSRYGMELLPAFAIGTASLCAWAERRIRVKNQKYSDTFFLVMLLAVVFNVVAMLGFFGTMIERVHGSAPKWLTRPPLVYEEGVVNARTRIPFEVQLSKEMLRFGDAVIMFDTNDHIGAVQDAGIPLKRLISPLDRQSFDRARENPARYADAIIALDGDPVLAAVKAHPQNLTELEVLCHTGQPCAHIYRSDDPGRPHATSATPKPLGAAQ
jgi:hypothetical protein